MPKNDWIMVMKLAHMLSLFSIVNLVFSSIQANEIPVHQLADYLSMASSGNRLPIVMALAQRTTTLTSREIDTLGPRLTAYVAHWREIYRRRLNAVSGTFATPQEPDVHQEMNSRLDSITTSLRFLDSPMRHSDLYFDDGNVVLLVSPEASAGVLPHNSFKVEYVLFKLHRSFLTKDPSSVFTTMFSLPSGPAEGHSDASPIKIPEVSSRDFAGLVKVLYTW